MAFGVLLLYNMKTANGVKIVQRITIQYQGSRSDGVQFGVYLSPGIKRSEFYMVARNATVQIIIVGN